MDINLSNNYLKNVSLNMELTDDLLDVDVDNNIYIIMNY